MSWTSRCPHNKISGVRLLSSEVLRSWTADEEAPASWCMDRAIARRTRYQSCWAFVTTKSNDQQMGVWASWELAPIGGHVAYQLDQKLENATPETFSPKCREKEWEWSTFTRWNVYLRFTPLLEDLLKLQCKKLPFVAWLCRKENPPQFLYSKKMPGCQTVLESAYLHFLRHSGKQGRSHPLLLPNIEQVTLEWWKKQPQANMTALQEDVTCSIFFVTELRLLCRLIFKRRFPYGKETLHASQ